MSTKRKNIQPKWKIYLILTLLIAAGTTALDFGMMLVSYPTDKHREVSRSLARLDSEAFSAGQDMTKVLESDKYLSLKNSTENAYSTRMSIASGIVSVVIAVSITVAMYRYLRRHNITRRAVGATVLISVLATFISAIPGIYMTQWLTVDSLDPIVIIMMIAATPFAIGFVALASFLIAKAAEWHYNRSHGFMED